MAADLEHPERVVGFHFFNPVAVMPLLEIVQGDATDDATLATAFATGKALKKTTHPGQGQPVLRRQPAARPLHGRGRPDRRRGHPGRGRRRRVRRGRADAAVRPALAGRPGDRAAQQRDAARRVPGALLRLRRTCSGWWRRARRASYYGPDGSVDPEVEDCFAAARPGGTALPSEVRERTLSRARGGGSPDARRGRRRRSAGHRPGDDHRRRLLVLERRADLAARPSRASRRRRPAQRFH